MYPNYELIQADVRRSLEEDVGSGDITANLIPEHLNAEAEVISREPMFLCGTQWFDEVMKQVSPMLKVFWIVKEGQWLETATTLCRIQGPARALLTAERTALNFLQTLSATATQTSYYVNKIKNYKTKILDTRNEIIHPVHKQL